MAVLKNRARDLSANQGVIHDRRPTEVQWTMATFKFALPINKPVAHLISITWPSIETFRSRKIEAYQRHRNKKWKRQQ
jgi:hypothetical protein